MKLLVILTLFSALMTCEKEDLGAKLGETFALKTSESKKMMDGQTSIEVKVTKIADGRCPEGVQCFRAGEAVVTTDVMIGDEKFSNVSLCLQCGLDKIYPFGETAEIKAKAKTYKLMLSDVSPSPKATGTVNASATMTLQ